MTRPNSRPTPDQRAEQAERMVDALAAQVNQLSIDQDQLTNRCVRLESMAAHLAAFIKERKESRS